MKKFFNRPEVSLWLGVLIGMFALTIPSNQYWVIILVRIVIMLMAWGFLYRAIELAERKGRAKEKEKVFNVSWHRRMGKSIHSFVMFNAACNAGSKAILWYPDGKVLSPALREEEIEGALQIVANYGRKLDEIKGGFHYSFFASARDSGKREATKHIFDELKKFYTIKK